MAVPFFVPEIGDDEIAEVIDSMKSGWLTTGPKCKQFEQDMAKFLGVKHALAVNSATSALHLALEAIGIVENDLVFVPSMTFTATAEVVRYLNATPVLVDCQEDSFCIDPEHLRHLIQRLKNNQAVPGVKDPQGKTLKAIMPVHYAGQMADVEAISQIAEEFGLEIIDDAAHALPSAYRKDENSPWIMAGKCAKATALSFYANKTMTTGEGGMLLTDDDEIAKRASVMRLHGISRDAWDRFKTAGSWYYEVVAPGYKYNMTDIAAAIGIHQLKKITAFRDGRSRGAMLYNQKLENLAEVLTPQTLPNRQHAWHIYVLRVLTDKLSIDRDAFIEELTKREIVCSVHYTPLHRHPYYRDSYDYKAEDFPVTENICQQVITLPLFPSITEEQIDEVSEAVTEVCRKYRK